MPPQNDWQIGALYPSPGGLGGFWIQETIGGIVKPMQQTGTDYFSIKPFSELSGIFSSPCSHWFNYPLVQREYDYNTNSSVALICCCVCGFIIYNLEPFESALNTVEQPWLVA